MAAKTDFTPEEWKTLLESVMMAGIAVTAADPSGLWGTLKESMASAHAVMGATRDASANQLIKAVTSDWGRTRRRPRRSADATIREETLRNHCYCLGSP